MSNPPHSASPAAVRRDMDVFEPDHAPGRRRRAAFTLVELLVVMTIIGILVSLLLPAVSSAREAARRAQCKNNLRNLGQAILQHDSHKGYLPTGGWGFEWIGDPDRGSSIKQPGSWEYCILPYIDQIALSRVGAGLQDNNGSPSSPKAQACLLLIQTPLAIFHCPSRRRAQLYAYGGASQINCAVPTNPAGVARTDYAANGGDDRQVDATQTWQPSSFSQGDMATSWSGVTPNSGVVIQRTPVRMEQITDGASNTYLVGEKYLCPDNYFNGYDGGDNETVYSGLNWDTTRTSGNAGWGYQPPAQDTPAGNNPAATNLWNFGSVHPNSFGMVLCDGSVHDISYSIDPETHRRLANRADGLPIDVSNY